jgi:hypothetical protein
MVYLFLGVVLRTELRALGMLGKCSVHPKIQFLFLPLVLGFELRASHFLKHTVADACNPSYLEGSGGSWFKASR